MAASVFAHSMAMVEVERYAVPTIETNNSSGQQQKSLALLHSDGMVCDFYSTVHSMQEDTTFLEPMDLEEDASFSSFFFSEMSQAWSTFEVLPEELLFLIFSFLHGSDVSNAVQRVCKNWRRLGKDDQLWLAMLRRSHPEGDIIRPANRTWKWLYQSRHLIINNLENIKDTMIVGRYECPEYIYEGEWIDGKHNGHGKKIYKNASQTESEAKEENDINALAEEDGMQGENPNQQSLPKKASRIRRKPVLPYYEGEWKDGKEHGKGKRIFEEDHYYVGDWKEGDREGFGFYQWPNKTCYEGEFIKGFRDGTGTYTWSEKAKYIGQWQNGIEHGKGTRTWADGDKYDGDWVQGTRTGFGLYAWPNGSSYEGKWLQCAHEGYGVYKWPDGRHYKGNFSNNKKHGYGEYFWPDGAMFAGCWKNGVRHGEGVMTWPDGAKFQGEWNFDRRASGKYWGAFPEVKEVPSTIGASWAKKYDYYFAMPMDMWEQMYLPEINRLIKTRKEQEDDERKAKQMHDPKSSASRLRTQSEDHRISYV